MALISSRYTYEGTETTETSITRVGSPLDPTGSQQSRNIVTTANSQWLRPFKAEPYVAWNGVTDSNVTATVYGIINSDVLPNSDDIWTDIEYLTASSSTLGRIVTTTKSNVLAAGAAVTSDSSTWNNLFSSFNGTPTANITMSNNNLTVNWISSGTQGVSSLAEYSTGKYYIEFTITYTTIGLTEGVGLKLSTVLLTNFASASTIGSCSYMWASTTGELWIDGVTYDNASGKAIGQAVSGDVACAAFDLDNHLVWWRRNNGNWNNTPTANPATGVGGLPFVAGFYGPTVKFAGSGAGKVVTGNFGASAFAFTAPAGFVAWNKWTPFKLTATLDLNATAPVAAVPATWDSATATAVTLSGGNLVVTSTTSSGDQGARGANSVGKTTGKYYFEVTVTTNAGGGNTGFGVGTTASTYTAMGNNATSGGQVFLNGAIYSNGVNTGFNIPTVSTGSIVGIAVDLDNHKIWFRNGASGNWNALIPSAQDPATNLGGMTLPTGTIVPFCTFNASGNVFTANFGATTFSGAVPSGFTAGWFTLALPAYHAPVGYIEARVRAAKASTTYYIDPTIQLSPTTPTAGATTPYTTSRYTYEGTETTETSITRVNGAADPLGNKQSRKIVTTANSQWLRPFKAEPYVVWNNMTGADVSVTVCGTVNSGALPLNDEIWMDVEYFGKVAAVLQNLATLDGTATNTTMSNGNLTATHSNANTNSGARSTMIKTSGRFYFEATFNTTPTGSDCVGIMQNTATFTNPVTSGNNCSAAYGGGTTFSADFSTAVSMGAFTAGNILSVAIDLYNAKCWFRKNGGTWNPGIASGDPVAGTGSSDIETPNVGYVPFVGFTTGGSGNSITVNFGASAFAYAVPAGFTAGWGTPAAAETWLGKIVTTTKANVLATGTSVTSDSSTWSTPPFTVWNPSDITFGVLSNSYTTVSATSGSSGGVRGINSLSAGKFYWEYTYTNVFSNSITCGIALASTVLSAVIGSSTIVRNTGVINVSGNPSGSSLGVAIGTGGTIGVAVDFTNQLIWYRLAPAGNWNGSGTANPATGAGGVSISSISTGPLYPYGVYLSSDVLTANFGVSAFSGSVPSGFTAGFTGTGLFTPFKLTTTLSSPQPGVAGYIHVRPRVAKASSTFYIDPKIVVT